MRKSPNRLRFGIGKWQECIQLSPQSASLVESRSPCLLYEDMPTRWYRGHVSMCSAKGGGVVTSEPNFMLLYAKAANGFKIGMPMTQHVR